VSLSVWQNKRNYIKNGGENNYSPPFFYVKNSYTAENLIYLLKKLIKQLAKI
jgi:hypothetical protein